jgi:hypothetical protein
MTIIATTSPATNAEAVYTLADDRGLDGSAPFTENQGKNPSHRFNHREMPMT